jgi:hypothetical protein
MAKMAKLVYRKKLLAGRVGTYRKVAKEMWPLRWSRWPKWPSDRNWGAGGAKVHIVRWPRRCGRYNGQGGHSGLQIGTEDRGREGTKGRVAFGPSNLIKLFH